VYRYNHPEFGSLSYSIFHPLMVNTELSWIDAENMCQSISSVMIQGKTIESLDEIQMLLTTNADIFINPAMVFLHIQRKQKVSQCVNNLVKKYFLRFEDVF